MGTKKQTMRNRLLAFAVVMVYTLALLPSFAFAAAPATDQLKSAAIGGKTIDVDTDTAATVNDIPYKTNGAYDLVITPETGKFITSVTVAGGDEKVTAPTAGAVVTIPMTFTGTTTQTVVVKAADNGGTTNEVTYTWTLSMKAIDTNATLSALTVSHLPSTQPAITWDKTVDENMTGTATAAVPFKTEGLNITATATSGNLTTIAITNNGKVVADPSKTALIVGVNTIVITATAQDGTTKTARTLTVTRTAAQENANVSDITVDNAPDDYTFNAATKNYTFNVPANKKDTKFNVTLADDSKLAAITVDGKKATDATDATVSLNPGQTKAVKVVVTPEKGTATTYTYTITRPKTSSDATLSALEIDGVTLSPKFDADTYDYTGKFAYSATDFWIKPTLASKNATINAITTAATGVTVTEDTTPDSETFGQWHVENIVNGTADTVDLDIEVIAEDTVTTINYNLDLTRAEASKDASVKSIALGGAWTEKNFDAKVKEYAGTITAADNIMMTVVTNDPTAAITIPGVTAPIVSGTAFSVPTTADDNTIVVTVTSEDGNATETYTYKLKKDKTFAGPTNVRPVAVTETTATFRFTEPKGMEKYAVYYRVKTYTNDGAYVYGAAVNKGTNDITVKNLLPGTTYEFIVTAGKTVNGKFAYMPLVGFTPKELSTNKWISTAAFEAISKDATSITFAYESIPGVESYAIYYGLKPDAVTLPEKFVYGGKSATGAPITVKGLDATKEYCFVLTTAKTVNGKLSYLPINVAMGSAHIDTQANATGLPTDTNVVIESTDKADIKDVTVKYVGVTGVEAYALYVSDAADGTYTYAAKTTNPNVIKKAGLDTSKAKYYKLTAGKTVNGKMTYKELKDVTAVQIITAQS